MCSSDLLASCVHSARDMGIIVGEQTIMWSGWRRAVEWWRARPPADSTDSVRAIVGHLAGVDPGAARYAAAFVFVVCRATRLSWPAEGPDPAAMAALLRARADVTADQALRAIEVAVYQARLVGATDDFLVTREFRQISTVEQRLDLVECLFTVCATGGSMSAREEAQIRQICSELGFAHHHYIAMRTSWMRERDGARQSRMEWSSGR